MLRSNTCSKLNLFKMMIALAALIPLPLGCGDMVGTVGNGEDEIWDDDAEEEPGERQTQFEETVAKSVSALPQSLERVAMPAQSPRSALLRNARRARENLRPNRRGPSNPPKRYVPTVPYRFRWISEYWVINTETGVL